MKTVREISTEVSTDECIDVITILHRNNFFHPGLILSSSKIRKHYMELINEIKNTTYKPTTSKLNFKQNLDKTLTLFLDDKKLHEVQPDLCDVVDCIVEYPRNITKEGIFLEFLYEYSILKMKQNMC